jgi:hypothetical protein
MLKKSKSNKGCGKKSFIFALYQEFPAFYVTLCPLKFPEYVTISPVLGCNPHNLLLHQSFPSLYAFTLKIVHILNI